MSSFMDRLKAGAEQAKELAGQAAGQAKDMAGDAAARAKDEARELQVKRELGQAYDDLGRAAYELWEQSELQHPHLESRARRIKTLKEQLAEKPDAAGSAGPADGAESTGESGTGGETPSG